MSERAGVCEGTREQVTGRVRGCISGSFPPDLTNQNAPSQPRPIMSQAAELVPHLVSGLNTYDRLFQEVWEG